MGSDAQAVVVTSGFELLDVAYEYSCLRAHGTRIENSRAQGVKADRSVVFFSVISSEELLEAPRSV
jgi:hypothetical protein